VFNICGIPVPITRFSRRIRGLYSIKFTHYNKPTALKMKKLSTLLIPLSIFLTAASAQTVSSIPDTATLSFITAAIKGNIKEIKSGELAQRNGRRPGVKSFGSLMVTNHTKAKDMLMQAARSKGYFLPIVSMSETDHEPVLEGISGNEFDKKYIANMLNDHIKNVALFERASTNIPDADIKNFAAMQLPALKQHLIVLKQLDAVINRKN
jgi:putative membrane protein